MDSKVFGKKIKLARVELDLTQTDLANEIGTKQKNVSRYENGISTPSLETMARIAKALKRPIDSFIN